MPQANTGLKLIAITNRHLSPTPLEVQVEQALLGGVSAVMLREKDLSQRELVALGKSLRRLCDLHQALFIINGSPEAALACGADGVHLGYDAPSLRQVRQEVGSAMWVGVSAHSALDLERAIAHKANYATVSPVFSPNSKKSELSPLGLTRLAEWASHFDLPLVALGGIDTGNAAACLAAGACGVAVIGAIFGQKKTQERALDLARCLGIGS